MKYLLLAIVSSALISVVMRLSEKKITGNVAMLAMNYVTCLVVASAYAGFELLPASPALPQTLAMGTVHGALFLCSFVLLQRNIQKSGVVLSSLFQRLGLLVSLAAVIVYPTFSVGTILVVTLAGVVLFGEKLSRRQWAALGVILAALVLLNI